MGDAYEAIDAMSDRGSSELDRLRDENEELRASLAVVVEIAVKQRDVLNAFVFDVMEMQLLDEMEPYINAYADLGSIVAIENVVAVCVGPGPNCHDEIHAEPEESTEQGWLVHSWDAEA